MRIATPSLTVLLALAAAGFAEDRSRKLKVGVFDRPPLAMKDTDGHWTGIAVDPWETASSENGFLVSVCGRPFLATRPQFLHMDALWTAIKTGSHHI
jgi:hypothetical protein